MTDIDRDIYQTLHSPNARGFFPIMSLHRDDVAQAMANYGPEALAQENGADFDDVPDVTQAWADALTDDQMMHLAYKLGDDLMNGGDYYEALAERATEFYKESE